jgi:hypothetical protein
MISITIPTNDTAINFSQKKSERALLKKICAAYDYLHPESYEWKSEWFVHQLKIELPVQEDMDYSDKVWWDRKDQRDELIEYEDLYDLPDSEWADVFYELTDEEDEEDEEAEEDEE